MERRLGILEYLITGTISYGTADKEDRRKLLAVFAVALLFFSLHLVQGIRHCGLQETTATVLATRQWEGSKRVDHYATVEYTVKDNRYSKEIRVDAEEKVGDQIQIFYYPDQPQRVERKRFTWLAFLVCLFHLVVMLRTGLPAYLCKRIFRRSETANEGV